MQSGILLPKLYKYTVRWSLSWEVFTTDRGEQNGPDLKVEMEVKAQTETTRKLQLRQKSIQGQNMGLPAATFTIKLHFPFIFCSLNGFQSKQIWNLYGYIQNPGSVQKRQRSQTLLEASVSSCLVLWTPVDLMEILWQVYMTKLRILSKQLFPVWKL